MRSKNLSFFKVFCSKSSATDRRRHRIHTVVGKQAEQKQTDRMTHSRLCFPAECDSSPPQAVSQETCWYGREVKRQLNVLASLDKFNGTAVLRGWNTRNASSPLPVQEGASTISVFVLLVPSFFTSLALLVCQKQALNKSDAVTACWWSLASESKL